jgi:hypothetical protein
MVSNITAYRWEEQAEEYNVEAKASLGKKKKGVSRSPIL